MVDVRNAVAVARVMELTEYDVRAAGLNGTPLDLFLGREAVLTEAATLQSRAAALSVTAAAVPYLTRTGATELVSAVERVALTAYHVPQDCGLPNWLNVKCGLVLVDRWTKLVQQSGVSLAERPQLLAKLRQVSAAVFSSKALCCPEATAVAARGEERRRLGELMGPLNVDEDLPHNVEFTTALEIAQDTLRLILKRFCWLYRVEVIEGDGNCYYRAVVRALTPHVPRDFEDSFSLQLRQQVNDERQLTASTELKELSEFEVTDESDHKTMAVAGVWADHVQIAKVAAYLGRRIWLLRCDDAELKMSDAGQLIPSEHYQIGPESGSALAPIVLYYQASPGHFETLVEAEQPTMQEAIKAADVSLLSVCDCFFRFETAQNGVEQMSERRRDFMLPFEVRQSIGAELQETLNVLSRQLVQFRDVVRSRFRLEEAKSDKAYPLFGELVEQLAADAGGRISGDLLGPLQQLSDRLVLHKIVGGDTMMGRMGMGDPYRAMGMPTAGQYDGRPNSSFSAVTRAPSMYDGRFDDADDEDDAWPVGMYSPNVKRKIITPEKRPSVISAPQEDKKPSRLSSPAVPDSSDENKAEPRARRHGIAEKASDLLESDDVQAEEWEPLLLQNVTGNRLMLEVRGITMSQAALKTFFSAIAMLTASKKLRVGIHLQIVECRLDDDCCTVLLKPPRNLSLVSLERCTFNAPEFGLRFSVKQHLAVKV